MAKIALSTFVSEVRALTRLRAVIDTLVGRSLDEAFIRRRVGRFAVHCSALSASLVSRVWGTIFGAAAKGTTAPYLKRFSAGLVEAACAPNATALRGSA